MSPVRLNGSTSGFTELSAPAVAGNNTLTLPSTTGGTLVASDSTGNVGIGNSAPANGRLNVTASTNQLTLDTGDTTTYGRLDIGHFGNGSFIGTYAGSNTASDIVRLGTGGSERLRITSTGSLLVGYTSSSASGAGVISAAGYAGKQGVAASTFGNVYNFNWSGSSLQAWIDGSNVGNVTLTSDYRIKKNIQSQTGLAIPRIKQLRPVTFEYANYGTAFKEDGVHREGFIAHELAEVIPSGVEGEKDAENQIQSIRIDAVVSVLTKALQEAIAQIESQGASISALESRITALEATP
jgi:hypothetical protein